MSAMPMPDPRRSLFPPTLMDGFVRVCHVDQLVPDRGRAFRVGDRIIAVFKTLTGAIFAIDNRAPNHAGQMSDGVILGDTVVAPNQPLAINLATGATSARSVSTHATRLHEGFVYVELPTKM